MAEVISKRSVVYDILFQVESGKKSAKEAQEAIEKIGTELDKTAKKSQSLTAQFRALRNELGKEEFGSKKFIELSISAAKVQDKIEKINQRVRNLASNTRHIDALISATQGLAGAFAVVQGASALLGRENEDLQKGLLKIQASIAILNGLQQAQQVLMTESAAKTAIATAAQSAYNFVVTAGTTATKLFRAALLATGAGVVLAALGTIIAYWDDIKNAIGGANKELETYNKKVISEAQNRSKILRARGESDYKEQRKILLTELADTKKTEEEKAALKADLKALEIERANELRQQDLEDAVSFAQAELDIQEEGSREQLEATKRLLSAQENLEIDAAYDNVAKIIEIDQKYYNLKLKADQEFQKKLFEQRRSRNTVTPDLATQGVPTQLLTELQMLTAELYIQQKAWNDLNGSMSEWIKLADGTMIKGTIPALSGGLREITEKQLKEQQLQVIQTANAIGLYTQAVASSAGSLESLAQEGSAAQIALAEVQILASYASAIANAIAGATASGVATGPAALFTTPSFIATLVATTVGAFAASFANLQKAKSVSSGGSNTATAFAEGEVDIHRQGETRGKDSIPAIIMPGESVITTDKTKQYKPFLEAIHSGNLEDLIRVNYVEPALAVKALEGLENDSRQIDYSEKFYRQYLATGEGNVNGKRMVNILSSIDRKLTPKTKRHLH